MSVVHTFDHSLKRIFCKTLGSVSGEELLTATRQAYDCLMRSVAYDCRYYQPYDKLVDCTDLVSIDISPNVLRSLATLDSEYLSGSKVAVVGNSMSLRGADTLYTIFVDVMGRAVDVGRFSTHHEAENWLKPAPGRANLSAETTDSGSDIGVERQAFAIPG